MKQSNHKILLNFYDFSPFLFLSYLKGRFLNNFLLICLSKAFNLIFIVTIIKKINYEILQI